MANINNVNNFKPRKTLAEIFLEFKPYSFESFLEEYSPTEDDDKINDDEEVLTIDLSNLHDNHNDEQIDFSNVHDDDC